MWSFESLLLWKRNVMIFCYGFIMLFVASVHPVTATLLQNATRRWLIFTKVIARWEFFLSHLLDLCVVLVKLIVDGCFCSDLLSTGWSGGNRSFPASTGGGSPRDARVAGAFGSGLFWRFGFYIWTWIIKPVPWKSVRVSCPVCLREGFAGRDADESTQERASHQLQSAQFILLFQPVQQHALLIPHQQRFVQSTACPAQIRWVWSWCSEWRVCHFRFFSVSVLPKHHYREQRWHWWMQMQMCPWQTSMIGRRKKI